MEPLSLVDVSTMIRKRQSVYPDQYTDEPIDEAIINEMLENANWAPNHKKTEPWRFRVFRGEALKRLSDYLGKWYVDNTPAEKFSNKKLEKTKQKPLQSACVIAICMARDEQERLPEWEEIAAVACAVQNMWLTCTAHQIGSYWSSPRSIIEAKEFLNLGANERCLGLFYMGYQKDVTQTERKRKPISEKVIWYHE